VLPGAGHLDAGLTLIYLLSQGVALDPDARDGGSHTSRRS
jgi:hypothetical protein